jgi:hypothetical protein
MKKIIFLLLTLLCILAHGQSLFIPSTLSNYDSTYGLYPKKFSVGEWASQITDKDSICCFWYSESALARIEAYQKSVSSNDYWTVNNFLFTEMTKGYAISTYPDAVLVYRWVRGENDLIIRKIKNPKPAKPIAPEQAKNPKLFTASDFYLKSLKDAYYLLDGRLAVERSLALGAEFYRAFLQGEERMVAAEADISPSHYRSAALADDNSSRPGLLPVGKLDTQVFRVRIS